MTTGKAVRPRYAQARIARAAMFRALDQGGMNLKARLVAIYGVLAVLNTGAWAWAFAAFHDSPALLGISLLVYGLGLRHAVDADHIAAIDNVTRKLMGENKRPVSVGFFFALGHSAIVILVAAAVAGAVTTLGSFQSFGELGGTISSVISAVFLFAIAAMNIVVFAAVWRSYRRVRAGAPFVAEDLDTLLNSRGFLTRMFRPLFRLITKSWHMFPLGFLFGLGFDTATEVTMFGLAAAQAADGVPLHAILVFPLLFAAAMSLVDTTDGVLMLWAYEWALVEPVRKLRYNMVITLASALVAIAIGAVGVLELVTATFGPLSGLRELAASLGESLKDLGIVIILACLGSWALSYLAHRTRQLRLANPAPGQRP
jgi:high-affinity nickel-transport protein